MPQSLGSVGGAPCTDWSRTSLPKSRLSSIVHDSLSRRAWLYMRQGYGMYSTIIVRSCRFVARCTEQSILDPAYDQCRLQRVCPCMSTHLTPCSNKNPEALDHALDTSAHSRKLHEYKLDCTVTVHAHTAGNLIGPSHRSWSASIWSIYPFRSIYLISQ